MYSTLATLLDRLDSEAPAHNAVIPWGSPVPFFGDLPNSAVATLGLNPSNKEFVDESGKELLGTSRRLHTLTSLGLRSWSEIEARHMRLILRSCQTYFQRNSYDRWFGRLDHVVAATGTSYYYGSPAACHLDLIPYATQRKWTDLTATQRSALLVGATDTLASLLEASPIRVIILNGKSVVDSFGEIAGITFVAREMPSWSLPRHSVPPVLGFAYEATIRELGARKFGRDLLVLGFNHNLQSSFGVTSKVLHAIRSWLGQIASEVI